MEKKLITYQKQEFERIYDLNLRRKENRSETKDHQPNRLLKHVNPMVKNLNIFAISEFFDEKSNEICTQI